jgi:hypothetical protein
MPIGLDWGTSTVIACRNVADEDGKKHPKYRKIRNCYLNLEATDFLKKIVRDAGLSFVELDGDDEIYVVDEDALRLASMLSRDGNRVELKRPMASGVMQGDAKATRVMQAIAQSALSKPEEENEVCVFSIPADPVDADFKIFRHKGMAEMALKRLHWTPKPIYEALAVVYSEAPVMKDREGKEVPFTGIGVSCGGGMINVCVAYRGMPTISFSLANAFGMGQGSAGDWIDNQLAGEYLKQMGSKGNCTMYKEQFTDFTRDPWEYAETVAKESHICPGDTFWHGEVLMAIRIYYENLLDYVITKLVAQFEKERPSLDGDLEFVVAGGTSAPNGFETLFSERLAKTHLPFRVSGVRKSTNPVRAVARGCMGAAESGYDGVSM